jgi:hypothetical protein
MKTPNQGLNDSYTFAEKAASAKDLPWAPCAAPNNMFEYVQHYANLYRYIEISTMYDRTST